MQSLQRALCFILIAITFLTNDAPQSWAQTPQNDFEQDLAYHRQQMRANPEAAERQALFVTTVTERFKTQDIPTQEAIRQVNAYVFRAMKEGKSPNYEDIQRHYLSVRDDLRRSRAHIDDPNAYSSGLQKHTGAIEALSSFHPVSTTAGGLFAPTNLWLNGDDAREKEIEKYAQAYRRSKNLAIPVNEMAELASVHPAYRVFARDVLEPVLDTPISILAPEYGPIPSVIQNSKEAVILQETVRAHRLGQAPTRGTSTEKSPGANSEPSMLITSDLFKSAVEKGILSLGDVANQLNTELSPTSPISLQNPPQQLSEEDIAKIAQTNAEAIDAAQSTLRLTEAMLLVLGESKAASQVAIVGSSLLSVAMAANQTFVATKGFATFSTLAAGSATFGLGTAVLGSILAIKSIFGGGADGTKLILRELGSVRREMRRSFHEQKSYLQKMMKHLDSRLHRIMRTQLELLTTVMSAYVDLMNGQIKQEDLLKRLESRLVSIDRNVRGLFVLSLELSRVEDESSLDEAHRSCVRSPDVKMRETFFDEALQRFVSFSSVKSRHAPYLASGDVPESLSVSSIPAGLDGFWFLLPRIISPDQIGAVSNPSRWLEGAKGFYECTSIQSHLGDRVSRTMYEDLIRSGAQTQQALEGLSPGLLEDWVNAHRKALTELQSLLPKAMAESLNDKGPLLTGKKFVPEEISFSGFRFRLSENVQKKLTHKFKDLDRWNLGAVEVRAKLISGIKDGKLVGKQTTKQRSLAYSPDNIAMDNDFLARWDEIRANDRWMYFFPKAFRGWNLNPVPFQVTRQSIFPQYPLIDWQFTHRELTVELKIGISSPSGFKVLKTLQQNLKVMEDATPLRRNLDLNQIMKGVRKAYRDPKLGLGERDAKLAIGLVQESIQNDHLRKIRVTHKQGQGFKKGPFPLNPLRYEIISLGEQISQALEAEETQRKWISDIAIPQELAALVTKTALERIQDATSAATGLRARASATQNQLSAVYESLETSKTLIQSAIRMGLSQSSVNTQRWADFATGAEANKVWGHSDFVMAIQSLSQPAQGDPDAVSQKIERSLSSLVSRALVDLWILEISLKERLEDVSKRARSFGERFVPVDAMLARLCVGYRLMLEERDALETSPSDIEAACKILIPFSASSPGLDPYMGYLEGF